MPDLNGLRVAVIANDGFEESELTEPKKALEQAGAKVDIIAPKPGQIEGFKHDTPSTKVAVDRTLDEANAGDYDAVQLPGGALNADSIRMNPKLQAFLRQIDAAGKPMAVICHAPWELISAELANGRTMTSYYTIQDDVRNAGANWVDREVVVDSNLVTSRSPKDLAAFNREMLALFAKIPAAGRR